LTIGILQIGPVAHQAAGLDVIAESIDRGDRMVRR
jgi:hypothetical protein